MQLSTRQKNLDHFFLLSAHDLFRWPVTGSRDEITLAGGLL